MSRSLSTVAKIAIFSQETAEVFLLLLTIAHPNLSPPIRVVNNQQDITSGGDTYTAFPFEITLPDEKEESIPRMRLAIDNVDKQIVQAMRSLTSPPTITLTVVLASQPDTVEVSFTGFVLRDVTHNALVVEGSLMLEDVLNEAYSQHSFTPNLYAGLFV